MPAISYREFGGGLDRRLPIGVQDANRLWTLRNAYITSGKKIRKRPGLALVTNLIGETVGLAALDGQLHVFALQGDVVAAPSQVVLTRLTPYLPYASGPTRLTEVLYAEMFSGYPYVVARHAVPTVGGGQVEVLRHHYVDSTDMASIGGASVYNTLVTDANCPHGESVCKAASRVFSIDTTPGTGDVVRYCAAGNANDWTTAEDAGFLPVSLQQDTRGQPTAVGAFSDALVVGFADGMQVWDVAVDPSANQLRSRHFGVGTQHPNSMAAFYRDLVFASPYGVRSMSVQEVVDRIDETDVGVPIDSLVVPVQQWAEANIAQRVRAAWLQQLGQYWLIYESQAGSVVYAYSYSRSAKLACWSEYTFPIVITGIASVAGRVYVRSESALYELREDSHTDAGTPIDVDVQMAYQDAKLPGVEKMFYGADYVFTGTASVSYLYDPRDQTRETIAQEITGDTRQGTMVPVEVTSAAIAPRFRHSAAEPFGLDAATLYFHQLSASSS